MPETSTRSAERAPAGDLLFDDIVRGYVDENPRFLTRDWLATELDDVLGRDARLVLLTGEPGTGKSAFVAQLARAHPQWPRYFIRRDQREPLADVSARSVLLRIGYQLAAVRPELFAREQVRITVEQRVGEVADHGEVVGVAVKRLLASPFLQAALTIRQEVERTHGTVVGLRVGELVVEERLLGLEDLADLALLDPARSLQRLDASGRIVVLIDGLDEIRYHPKTDDILGWLTNLPELPDNLRFVLTSRPPDQRLRLLRDTHSGILHELELDEHSPQARDDVQAFVGRFAGEPALRHRLDTPGAAKAFARRAVTRADGNLGYADALARGIDEAIAREDSQALDALLGMRKLPAGLGDLYAFFLHRIKASLAGSRVELEDPDTGDTFTQPAWPAIHSRVLAVLAVAAEPLDVELITRLGAIDADASWVGEALEDLRQFLDVAGGRYRLYHASLAEFLVADSTRTDPGAADLYASPARWHRRIANRYWALRADWTACDAYGLRHLAEHLDGAGDGQRLEELVTPAWMDARFTGDGYRYDGFLADLRLAWRTAQRRACDQIDAGAEPSALAAGFRCLLVNASILAQSVRYPAAVLARLLETGAWDLDRVLSVAFRITDDTQRVAVLTALLDTGALPAEAYDRARRDAVAAAATLIDSRHGAAVRRLAPHLDGDLLEPAWDGLGQISGKWHEVRAPAMAALAPRFTGARRAEALRSALAAAFDRDGDNRVELSLPALVPHLDSALLDEALALALASPRSGPEAIAILAPHLNPVQRARALAEGGDAGWLAPLVPDDAVERALTAALSWPQLYQRVAALSELAAELDEHRLVRAVALALGVEQAADWSEVIARVPDALLADLIPFAPFELLEANVDRVLPTGAQPSERVLAALAPHLYGELGARAMAALGALTPAVWARVVARWADHLEDGTVEQVLQLALEIESPDDRETAVLGLVHRLAADALERALPALPAIGDDYELRGLALRLRPGSEVGPSDADGTDQELDVGAACAVEDEDGRADALRTLVPHLREDDLDRALQAAEAMHTPARERLMAALAPRLTGERRRRACAEVLARVRPLSTFTQARERAALLVSVAPALDEDDVAELLRERWPSEVRRQHADVLGALAPRLTPAQARQVIDLARRWRPNDTARVLVSLAPHLAGEELEAAVAAAPHAMWGPARATALAALAPRFPAPERTMALLREALDSLDRPLFGTVDLPALDALAACLPAELWRRGLDTAGAVKEPGYRASALALFLPTAPDPAIVIRLVRRAIAEHVCEELADRSRPQLLRPTSGLRCEVLAAPWLGPPTLDAMAAAVVEVGDEWSELTP